MRLDDRVALITGGAGGIGFAVADRFVDAGAQVVLADLERDAVEEAAATLSEHGHPTIGLAADVSRHEDVDALVRRTLAELGRIDILVNTAGVIGPTAPIEDVTNEEWEAVLTVDLTSVFLCCRAVVPHMRSRKSGCIVSIASIAGKEGTPLLVPYSVAKAGIIALTKALGKEVILDGIRVNCVAPAVIDTPFLAQLPQAAVETMLSKAPSGRFGTAGEVASVTHFLASDEASFVTAQCYDVSGGRATY
jgi:2-dehydro-3-deoxy-L-rhamnonate dehydrogenase (NAD+)